MLNTGAPNVPLKYPIRFFSVTDRRSQFPSGLRNAVRLYGRFNAKIDRRLAESGLTPTQWRILIELFERPNLVDAHLADLLGLDRSFLSRTLKGLISDGLVSHKPGLRHRRQRYLFLTPEGTTEAERLRNLLGGAIADEFMATDSGGQVALLAAAGVQGSLGSENPADDPIEVRASTASDYPWFLRQMEINWSGGNIGFVGEVAAAIGRNIADRYDVGLRWTAVRGGNPVGVCLLTCTPEGLDLRLEALYVTASARQLGAGAELLRKAVEAARAATFLNIYALAPDPEKELCQLLVSAGFNKRRGKSHGFWRGRPAAFSLYRLAFPMPRM